MPANYALSPTELGYVTLVEGAATAPFEDDAVDDRDIAQVLYTSKLS